MAFGLIRMGLIYLVALNGFTLLMFAWDKFQAGRGGSRIAESTFYLMALIGGSAAILLGRPVLRHKTVKQPFGRIVLAIAVLQVLAVTGYLGYRLWGNLQL